MNISLTTDRLVIRSIRESDLADFLEYRSDPEVCKFQGFQPMTRNTARRFIRGIKDTQFGGAGEWIQLGVELKDGSKLIGDIGLKPEGSDVRVVEFGISFSTAYQKQGFATEALAGIFELLFSKVGIHRIIGVTDVRNADCIRLMEHLGFRREAEFRQSFWDEAVRSWRDEYLYAVLEEEWPMVSGRHSGRS